MQENQLYRNESSRSKLNNLLASVPVGVPMTSAWLDKMDISPQLVSRSKKSDWLKPLGRGVWLRAGSELTWAGAVFALQQQQSIRVYPAGQTALQLLGRAHYIPLGENPVLHLSIPEDQRLPAWFLKQAFANRLQQINSTTLFEKEYVALTDERMEGVTIKISTPERAMLEYCHLLPKHTDFEEARQLMQGLTTLRPALIQTVLQSCQSIKAKRLFLALAESSSHAWYEEINTAEIELGRGNRSIMPNGRLHPKFHITVPENWISR